MLNLLNNVFASVKHFKEDAGVHANPGQMRWTQSLEGKDGGRYRTLKSSLPTILIYLAESFLVDRKIFVCRIRPSAVISAEILTEKFLSGSWQTVRRDF